MSRSLFHSSLNSFISEEYPYTEPHPIEDPALLKSWGLNPKIYRPLPRASFHNEMEIEEVKSPYRDIPLLKKHLIDSSLLTLYRRSPPRAALVLFTWVYADGWGDYYAQFDCARLIEEHFPDAELTLVTCLRSDQRPPEKRANQHIITYEEGEKPHFSEPLLKKMRRAKLLFQFPTYYPHSDELMEMLGPQMKYEWLGESGFIDTTDFSPTCRRRCMGLHFLEKGIFIKSLPQKRASSPYYFAYTRSAEGLLSYVEALTAWKRCDLTLRAFNIQHVIHVARKGLPHVREIEVVIDKTLTSIPIAKSGALLRIEVMQNVPHHQFLTLLHESEEFVACTGDGSLFEAISAEKLFYYDMPEHKESFLKDLVALTKARTPDALPFFEDPKAIQYPPVREALRELSTIIRTEHRVNELLCHIIHRALCHHASPELEQEERRILDAFATGELNAPAALASISQSIRSYQVQ
ncbi:MAG: hypothetical protein K1060chlam2_00695 [Chlamydiae bacterium]|nr:hypothetical protein [Chlamydiota bacterium]